MGDRRSGRRLLADAALDASAANFRTNSPAARQRFLQGLPARIAGLARIFAAAAPALSPAPAAASLRVFRTEAAPNQASSGAGDSESPAPAGTSAASDRAHSLAPPALRRRGRPPVRPPQQLEQRSADVVSASAGGPESWQPDSQHHLANSDAVSVPGPPAQDDARVQSGAAVSRWDPFPAGRLAQAAQAEGGGLLFYEGSGAADAPGCDMALEDVARGGVTWGDDPFWDCWSKAAGPHDLEFGSAGWDGHTAPGASPSVINLKTDDYVAAWQRPPSP